MALPGTDQPPRFRCFLCQGQPIVILPKGSDPDRAWMKHYMERHYKGD